MYNGILVQAHSTSIASTVNTDLVDPIDYEKFVKENISLLESSPLKDMFLFPEDDITVTTLPRKFRTVEIPVPGPAKLVVSLGGFAAAR